MERLKQFADRWWPVPALVLWLALGAICNYKVWWAQWF